MNETVIAILAIVVFAVLVFSFAWFNENINENLDLGKRIGRWYYSFQNESKSYFLHGIWYGMSDAHDEEMKQYYKDWTSADGNWRGMDTQPPDVVHNPIDRLTREIISARSQVVAVETKDGFYFTRHKNIPLIKDIKIVKDWYNKKKYETY